MKQQPEFETSAEIRIAAGKHGFDVSEARLARWHRDGLIPQPRQKSLGRGKGTVSRYPAGTTHQVLVLCQIRMRYRSLDEVGWRLWWLGFPVGDHFGVAQLKTAAHQWDQHMAQLRTIHEMRESDDDLTSDAAFEQLERMANRRIKKSFIARIRKRVGKKNFETSVKFIVDIATGNFRTNLQSQYDPREQQRDDAIHEKTLGLTPARRRKRSGINPWLIGPIADALANLSASIGGRSFAQVIAATDTPDILRARDELHDIAFGAIAIVRGLQHIFGRNPLGFGVLADCFERASRTDLAFMLIAWCQIRTEPWASGYPEVVAAFREVHRLAVGVPG
jgi:hypothetical protein